MKKMFNDKNRKKSIGIICGIVAIIIVIVVAVLFINGIFNNKNKKLEKELTNRLEELGRSFYENYYYIQVGKDDASRIEFVKRHAKDSIRTDLANIARINSSEQQNILNEFKNAYGESCNASGTRVAIYPKEPYGVRDYDIEVTLDCGFNKNETTTTKKTDSKTTVSSSTKTKATTTKKKTK